MEVDKKIYNEIAAEIQSDDSPVGIDAKKNTHHNFGQAYQNRS